MYKTILVPLDGSKRAEAILPHVEELAARYQAEIVLLQVVDPVFVFSQPYDPFPELNMEEAERRVGEVEAYLAGRRGQLADKGVAARCVVEYGPVVQAILDVAERENADLIAMVSHGRTGLARVFYGSVTAGVLHRVDRPLLLVRAQ
ncbi:MAG: universal stress protein [Chloroflexi bacterium]|nr:universal stress protein [Chloroflexota bacterium]MCI0575667.1 universal stress protein [Chloroflexota bacterium]MCI0647530.1 universal stress protein [Chloroflexota bacterium]MCI0730841.1 universal stress protein [Chloroflexota bacterium]